MEDFFFGDGDREGWGKREVTELAILSLGLAVALPRDLNMALLILVLFKSIKILLI